MKGCIRYTLSYIQGVYIIAIKLFKKIYIHHQIKFWQIWQSHICLRPLSLSYNSVCACIHAYTTYKYNETQMYSLTAFVHISYNITSRSQQTQTHLYSTYTMLGQRRRRLAEVVYMLYNCFVFAGLVSLSQHGICVQK